MKIFSRRQKSKMTVGAVQTYAMPELKRAPDELTVMVIEDNRFLLETIGEYLRGRGIDVVVAGEGRLGLELYLADPERFNAIVLDIKMPGMGGVEVAKRIRACGSPNAEAITIIAMSGDSYMEEGAGISYTMKKPFDMETLLAALCRM